jgi:hypothetical protein
MINSAALKGRNLHNRRLSGSATYGQKHASACRAGCGLFLEIPTMLRTKTAELDYLRRLRFASPTVNKMPSRRDERMKNEK